MLKDAKYSKLLYNPFKKACLLTIPRPRNTLERRSSRPEHDRPSRQWIDLTWTATLLIRNYFLDCEQTIGNKTNSKNQMIEEVMHWLCVIIETSVVLDSYLAVH